MTKPLIQDMKYWTIKESLDRRIALKNFDRGAYLHTANACILIGVLIGVEIATLTLQIINLFA